MRVTNFSFVLCKLFPAEAVKSSPKIGGLVMEFMGRGRSCDEAEAEAEADPGSTGTEALEDRSRGRGQRPGMGCRQGRRRVQHPQRGHPWTFGRPVDKASPPGPVLKF